MDSPSQEREKLYEAAMKSQRLKHGGMVIVDYVTGPVDDPQHGTMVLDPVGGTLLQTLEHAMVQAYACGSFVVGIRIEP